MTRLRKIFYLVAQSSILWIAIQNIALADVNFIAGTTPSERPVVAPVITEVVKDVAWYKNALRGVEQPYPKSLQFLESQGNWFTPFTHAGMTGRYDIRGWHTGQ